MIIIINYLSGNLYFQTTAETDGFNIHVTLLLTYNLSLGDYTLNLIVDQRIQFIS